MRSLRPAEGRGTETGPVVDRGRLGYRAGLRLQQDLAARRGRGEIGDTLLLCGHPPVLTLGTHADPGHILASPAELAARGIEVHRCDRGGQVTWHGPGQVVGYVIADLRPRRRDVHRFCRDLEEIMIRTLADHGLEGTREQGRTGVWIGGRKVGALGVRVRRWITTHGFALNVDCDLGAYERIIPCGIFDRGVTSMRAARGRPVARGTVCAALARHFLEIFGGQGGA
ncbi:MAG: lipoyl(octanoyl) transferase LipB [Planctomycetota bacterium]